MAAGDAMSTSLFGEAAKPADERPAGAGVQRVSLLDVDADLRRAVPAEHRERARPALGVEVYAVDAGEVDFAEHDLPESAFALLLVSGTLMHEVRLAGRELAELVLPGDVVQPWEPVIDGVPAERRFKATVPARFVALDQRFIRAASAWPELLITVHRRLNDQEHRVATHGVICQLPRVEQRILAMMWHLAGRIGKVGGDGTIVPLKVTHEQLGRMVGAQRPTVTLAAKDLAADGRLLRRDDGTWMLPGVQSPDEIGFDARIGTPRD